MKVLLTPGVPDQPHLVQNKNAGEATGIGKPIVIIWVGSFLH